MLNIIEDVVRFPENLKNAEQLFEHIKRILIEFIKRAVFLGELIKDFLMMRGCFLEQPTIPMLKLFLLK